MTSSGRAPKIPVAMEIEGRSAEELCQEAFEFLQQGRLAAAVERLEKVLAARPEYFDAHHYLGIAYGYMGRLDQAEEHLRKAVELLPDNAPARYNLGLILHYRGQHEEAMKEFRTSLELNPYYEPVRKILAELGEPVEQMVEEILEAQAAEEEEKKTFAEKFAEAPWAALREKEAAITAAPAVEEAPKPRANPILKGLVNGVFYGALAFLVMGMANRFLGLGILPEALAKLPLLKMIIACVVAGVALGIPVGLVVGLTLNPLVGGIVAAILFSLDKILLLAGLGIVKKLGATLSILGVAGSAVVGGFFGWAVGATVASAVAKEE